MLCRAYPWGSGMVHTPAKRATLRYGIRLGATRAAGDGDAGMEEERWRVGLPEARFLLKRAVELSGEQTRRELLQMNLSGADLLEHRLLLL